MRHLMETWKNYIAEIQSEESNVISFDFDDTLALEDSEYQYVGPNKLLLNLFRLFKEEKKVVNGEKINMYKVYIVTSRKEANEDMYRERPNTATVNEFVAEQGLNPDQVIFTNMEDKVHTLKRIGALLHFDDDDYEIAAIDKGAPKIGTVKINYANGAIMSGLGNIERLLGNDWRDKLAKLDDKEKENGELDG